METLHWNSAWKAKRDPEASPSAISRRDMGAAHRHAPDAARKSGQLRDLRKSLVEKSLGDFTRHAIEWML